MINNERKLGPNMRRLLSLRMAVRIAPESSLLEIIQFLRSDKSITEVTKQALAEIDETIRIMRLLPHEETLTGFLLDQERLE